MKRLILVVAFLTSFSVVARTLPNTSSAADIQAAIDDAEPGETITLADGTYNLTASINITNDVTLTGSSRDACILAGAATLNMLVKVNHENAVLTRVTVSNGVSSADWGSSAAGVNVYSGTVSYSRITRCKAKGYNRTGGVYIGGSKVFLSHCIVDHNTGGAASGVGGIYVGGNGAIIDNCLIYANTSSKSGGGICIAPEAWKPVKIVNCTVVGNTAVNGGGIACNTPYVSGDKGPWVNNSIISGNTATGTGADVWSSGTTKLIAYNCCTPDGYGTDAVSGDPLFNDPSHGDYTLQGGSPCKDTGSQARATARLGYDVSLTNDLVGADRVMGTEIDIGAYEIDPRVLTCSITMDKSELFKGQTVRLACETTGFEEVDDVTYSWEIVRRGTAERSVSSQQAFDFSPEGYGDYDVNVTATSATLKKNKAAIQQSFYSAPRTNYVATVDNPKAEKPYADWTTAANSVKEAIDVMIPGGVIMIAEGTNAVHGTISVTKGVEIVGAGRDKTVLCADAEFNTVMNVNHAAAKVRSLTIAHGRMSASWSDSASGLLIGASGGTVTDCRITDCCTKTGVWSMQGAVKLNSASAVLSRCLIDGNSTATSSGNSTCGGVHVAAGRMDNCLVTNNTGRVYGNYAASGVIVEANGKMINCTVMGNRMNTDSGAGVQICAADGRVRNSIIDGNTRSDGTEANHSGTDASYSYCLSSDAFADASVGCLTGRPVFVPRTPLVLKNGTPGCNGGSVTGYEAVLVGGMDFFGNPRIKRTKKNGQIFIDMGCTESSYYPIGLLVILR